MPPHLKLHTLFLGRHTSGGAASVGRPSGASQSQVRIAPCDSQTGMVAAMRQAVERAAKAEKRKIGEKAVRTLTQITRQMRIIYAEARNNEIDIQRAGTLVRILERLRLATASSVYDARLDRLEERLNARDAQGGWSNGHEVEDLWHDDEGDDDRHGVLQ
jgi:hypothetical protein